MTLSVPPEFTFPVVAHPVLEHKRRELRLSLESRRRMSLSLESRRRMSRPTYSWLTLDAVDVEIKRLREEIAAFHAPVFGVL